MSQDNLDPNRLGQQENFLKSLVAFTKDHKAAHWSGPFSEFVTSILAADAHGAARSSHQYMWDMIRWTGCEDQHGHFRCRLFEDELFGVDEAIERVVDYFKAAAAGSEVGRRLLLLLGPPSGGKSTLAILLKRGLEEYSYTDAGALYGIQGCPVHESPLHLVPHTLRPSFRSTYGVEIIGEICPYCRARLENQYGGDFMQMPINASSSPKPAGSGSAPMRRTTQPPSIWPIWSGRSTCPRWRNMATKAIRGRGRGRVPSMPPAEGCWR